MHSVSVGSGLFAALRRRRSWWRKSTACRGSHCPWEAATGSPGGPGPEATAAAAGARMRIAIVRSTGMVERELGPGPMRARQAGALSVKRTSPERGLGRRRNVASAVGSHH
uniref:Uncharacterized protein n=1 Tax=Rangifer tarandus platyrhynchus TaxID=3082113 RepID=A0ACB0FKC5_RANTA|nr:unnamed protein product [Rangifer tarandus platyrhynchus]